MSWKVWDFTFQTITAAFKKIHFGTPRRYRIRGWKLYIIHQVLQTYFSQRPAVTLPENNSKNPLEMDGCKISFLLGWPIIRSMGYLELTSETKWEKTCAYNIYIYTYVHHYTSLLSWCELLVSGRVSKSITLVIFVPLASPWLQSTYFLVT